MSGTVVQLRLWREKHPAKLKLEAIVCPYLDIQLDFGVKLGSSVQVVKSMRCKAKTNVECDFKCVFMGLEK